MKIIIGFNKHHEESCPLCSVDGEDTVPMERVSIDVYECQECGTLVMAGYNAHKISVREIIGKSKTYIEEYGENMETV